MDNRVTRDEMLMRFATTSAMRGTCTRLSVGAIISRNGRVISQGYVGSPPGQSHCLDVGCLVENDHCVRTTHAEINALIFAARHGIATEGAEVYITHSPCLSCAKAIVTAGISRVVYAIKYGDSIDDFLRNAGVKCYWYRKYAKDVNKTSTAVKGRDKEPEVQAVPAS